MQLEELLNQIRANRDQTAIVLSEYRDVVAFWKTGIGRFIEEKGLPFQRAFASLIHEVNNMDVTHDEKVIQMQSLGLAALEYAEESGPSPGALRSESAN